MGPIIVVDTETTGLEPPAAVVELAAIELMDGVVSRGRSTLVNPGIPIPPEMSAIHHIIDDDVVDEPDFAAAMALILPPDADVVAYAAHNSRFDSQWINSGGLPWIDTYRCAIRIWPDAPSHSNQALRYFLNLPVVRERTLPAHRALPDCYITAHLLALILEKISFDDAVKMSSRPAVLPKVNFGKHVGLKWLDVPTDYLEWCLNQDMHEDVIYTCRLHLQHRQQQREKVNAERQ